MTTIFMSNTEIRQKELIVDADLNVTFIQPLICIVIVGNFKDLMICIKRMYFIMVLF